MTTLSITSVKGIKLEVTIDSDSFVVIGERGSVVNHPKMRGEKAISFKTTKKETVAYLRTVTGVDIPMRQDMFIHITASDAAMLLEVKSSEKAAKAEVEAAILSLLPSTYSVSYAYAMICDMTAIESVMLHEIKGSKVIRSIEIKNENPFQTPSIEKGEISEEVFNTLVAQENARREKASSIAKADKYASFISSKLYDATHISYSFDNSFGDGKREMITITEPKKGSAKANKSLIMQTAWAIAKAGAAKFGHGAKAHFAEALKMAYAILK